MSDQKSNPGLKYDRDLKKEADKKHEFVVVRQYDAKGQPVKTKPSNRKVTGLPNFLLGAGKGDIIYNFKWRITGTENDIRAALLQANYTESDVRDAIRGPKAVGVGNINDPIVQAMIQQEKAEAKKAPEVYDTTLTLDDLALLAHKISTVAKVEPIKGSKVAATPAKKGKGGRRGGAIKTNLRERADNCGRDGKALNVTGLKEDMSGAKSCYKPSDSAKSMVYLPDHNIVSSNIEGVRLYFRHIGADRNVIDRAEAEWKSKSRAMEERKSARSPRGKSGGPVELPAAYRKGQAVKMEPVYRSPRSPRSSGRPASMTSTANFSAGPSPVVVTPTPSPSYSSFRGSPRGNSPRATVAAASSGGSPRASRRRLNPM